MFPCIVILLLHFPRYLIRVKSTPARIGGLVTRLLRLRSWLQRNRRWAFALSALFLIFEASRAFAIWQYLLPEWSARAAPPIAVILSLPPWIVVISTVLAIIFFVVPMAGVIYVGTRIRRALVPLLNKR